MTAEGDFTLDLAPMRVRLRRGAIEDIGGELERLGLDRALVLCTPDQSDLGRRVLDLAGPRAVGMFANAQMHVPIDVVDQAAALIRELGADSCVAAGGGSTIGLAKALGLRLDLPSVAIPTTYAGSEMTSIWGLTEDDRKRTGRDPKVRPVSVLYDPILSSTLPEKITAASGLNAVAHAVEALYAPDRSPLISLMAERGTALILSALRMLLANANAPEARRDALEGAWLCGICLGATTMGLHHKLCHVLGGTFNLPHAETHAVVLPHVIDFNVTARSPAQAALSRAAGTDNVASAFAAMGAAYGLPSTLVDLGVGTADVPRIVAQVMESPYSNPRLVDKSDLTRLVTRMIEGRDWS